MQSHADPTGPAYVIRLIRRVDTPNPASGEQKTALADLPGVMAEATEDFLADHRFLVRDADVPDKWLEAEATDDGAVILVYRCPRCQEVLVAGPTDHTVVTLNKLFVATCPCGYPIGSEATTKHYVVRWTAPVQDCDDPDWPLGRTLAEQTADSDEGLAVLLDQHPDHTAVYQDRRSSTPNRWLNRSGRCIGCDRYPVESCFC